MKFVNIFLFFKIIYHIKSGGKGCSSSSVDITELKKT